MHRAVRLNRLLIAASAAIAVLGLATAIPAFADGRKRNRPPAITPPCQRNLPAPGAILGALPAAQAPQLCQLVTSPPETGDWLSEIKLDGYRFIVSLDRGRARLRTRKGLDWADRLPRVIRAGELYLDRTIWALRRAAAPAPRRRLIAQQGGG
jgi:ATP-dependent DNA ligase